MTADKLIEAIEYAAKFLNEPIDKITIYIGDNEESPNMLTFDANDYSISLKYEY